MSSPEPQLVTQFAMLRQASHLTLKRFRSYWSDVHGPAVCLLPGIHEYVQHHLDHDRGLWWPQITGVERTLDAAAQFDGAPEVIFTSLDARERWLTLAEAVQVDEINVFSSMTHQLVPAGAAITYLDSPDPLDEDHPLRTFKLLVFLKARGAAPVLGDWLRQNLPGVAEDRSFRKVRLSILDPVEMSAWQPEGIAVDTQPEDDFAACLELEWPDYLAARRFYVSGAFAVLGAGIAEHARAINVFRCASSFRFVESGRRTLAGRFGASTAKLIREVGAVNRFDELSVV